MHFPSKLFNRIISFSRKFKLFKLATTKNKLNLEKSRGSQTIVEKIIKNGKVLVTSCFISPVINLPKIKIIKESLLFYK